MSDGAKIQYESVSRAGSQLNNPSLMVQQVASSAQNIAGITNGSSAAAEQGRHAVNEAISGIEQMRRTVLSSAAKIQTLGES